MTGMLLDTSNVRKFTWEKQGHKGYLNYVTKNSIQETLIWSGKSWTITLRNFPIARIVWVFIIF